MQEKKRIQEKEYSDTILARDWKDPKCVRIGGIFDTEKSKHQAGSIYDKEGISPTLDVMQGGWRQPSILENNFISNRQPKVLELNKNAKHQQDLIQHEDGLCRTIPAGTHGSTPHLLKTAILEGQSGLIQPVDRNYKEHKLKRETHVEFKSDDCSHALRTSVIPVTAVLKDGVDITWNKMGNTTDVSKALTTACRTLSKNQMATGVLETQINKIEIPQIVRVRKYNVNTEKLVETLRNAKIEIDITNKEIADKLNIPLTKVEHYFRKDSSFAIPDPQIWFQLKKLLNIKTDEFDKSIMTFEEKEGVYEKANRCYLDNGIAPTLTQQQESIITNLRIRKLTPKECWRLMAFFDEDFEKAQSVPTSNTQLYKQARKFNCC